MFLNIKRREIYKQVFSFVLTEPNAISHPPDCPYILSTQHARLNVYRCLARVCKAWRLFVLPIFFEDLKIHSDVAFKGLLQALHNDTLAENISRMKRQASQQPKSPTARRSSQSSTSPLSRFGFGFSHIFSAVPADLSRSIHSISFSFLEYRCSLSAPPRPRPLRTHEEIMKYCIPAEAMPKGPSGPINQDILPKELRLLLNADIVIRREEKRRVYSPNGIRQGAHWETWHSSINTILARCVSISHVVIDFSSATPNMYSRRGYNHLFSKPTPPKVTIAESLALLPNLRHLDMTDPSSLTELGPTLHDWKHLHTLRIRLSPHGTVASELGDTVFRPPKLLRHLEFSDDTAGGSLWPLSSDLGTCENLTSLHLGCNVWTDPRTMTAMEFLVKSYQHTLEELNLRLSRYPRHSGFSVYGPTSGLEVFLDKVFPAENPEVHERSRMVDENKLYFKNLRRLQIQGVCLDTTVFNRMLTEKLEGVSFDALVLAPVHLRTQRMTGMDADENDEGLETEEGNAARIAAWKKVLSLSSLNSLKVLQIQVLRQRDEEPLNVACRDAGVELIVGGTRTEDDGEDEEF